MVYDSLYKIARERIPIILLTDSGECMRSYLVDNKYRGIEWSDKYSEYYLIDRGNEQWSLEDKDTGYRSSFQTGRAGGPIILTNNTGNCLFNIYWSNDYGKFYANLPNPNGNRNLVKNSRICFKYKHISIINICTEWADNPVAFTGNTTPIYFSIVVGPSYKGSLSRINRNFIKF